MVLGGGGLAGEELMLADEGSGAVEGRLGGADVAVGGDQGGEWVGFGLGHFEIGEILIQRQR